MALIKCGECGKEVSEKVKTCLNCGDDIQKQIKLARSKRKWKDIPKSEKRQVVITSVVIGAIFLFCLNSCLSPKTPAEIEQDKKDNAAVACMGFIEQRLNVPGSVNFIHHGNKVMHIESNIYETNLDFTAKNAFGVDIPASYHCIVKLEGEDFNLVSLKRNH